MSSTPVHSESPSLPSGGQASGSPLISCLLTSYKRPLWVQRAINSVRTQNFSNWELLVLDDNSGETTLRAIEEAIAGDSRCRLLKSNVADEDRLSTCRYSVMINLGLREAKGDIVCYLTDDDVYQREKFSFMAAKFEEPGVEAAYEEQVVVQDGVAMGVRKTDGVATDLRCRADHNSVSHRRTVLERMEYPWWDEHPSAWGAGDAAFFWRLQQAGVIYHPIEYIGSAHMLHPDSIQARMIQGGSPIYG
jgi:glycosyltransferase involved in cell wall biosynthesis